MASELTKEEMIGKWLWKQNRRIHVLGPDLGDNGSDFMLIEEPPRWPDPRPVHWALLKDAAIIDPNWQPPTVELEVTTARGTFCSCGDWRIGMPLAKLKIQTQLDNGQLYAVLEALNSFLHQHKGVGIDIVMSGSHEDQTEIHFIAKDERPEPLKPTAHDESLRKALEQAARKRQLED